MKILFIAENIARFGVDGASHRSKQMLLALQAFGTVDVAVLPWGNRYGAEDFSALESSGRLVFDMPVDVRQTIHLCGLPFHRLQCLQGRLGSQLFTKVQKLFLHRKIETLSKAFHEAVRPENYDLIFVRYYRVAKWLALDPSKVVLDLDDCELESLKSEFRSPAIRGAQRLLSLLKYANVRRGYLKELPQYRRVLFAGNYTRHYTHANAGTYPNLYILPKRKENAYLGKALSKVIFIGNLEYAPNLQALHYLIRQVCPLLAMREPEIELCVYGKGHLAALSAHDLPSNVRLCGFISEISEVYDGALCALVPTQSGGGTHIKVLEAIAHGVPVIGSRFAFRGFENAFRPGKHYLEAGSATDFVDGVQSLKNEPEKRESILQQAYSSLEEHYGMNRNQACMKAALES